VSQKNCAFLVLSELHHISMNFNKFWQVDGKMSEIVCYIYTCIYIFHVTWPLSLHYFVKSGCSKFLHNTGFVTIRLFRFGVKVKRAYCRDNFLTQRPLPGMRRLSGDDFFCFNRTAPRRISTRTIVFLELERDARNASSSKCLQVSLYAGHISSTNSGNFEPICHDN